MPVRILAISGIDGSGKTTLIKAMTHELSKSSIPFETRLGFDYFLLRRFLLRFEKRAGSSRKNMNYHARKSILLSLWPYLVWMDLLIQRIYLTTFKSGKLIIFDRYVLDSLVSWEALEYSNLLIRWLYKLIIRTVMNIVLDVSVDVGRSRKSADDATQDIMYAKRRSSYLRFSRDLSLQVIDGNIPKEKVVKMLLGYLSINSRAIMLSRTLG